MDKKDKVQKILNTLSRIEKNKIPHIKNRINMDKITEVKEFKKALKELEGLGVDGAWLFDNGFASAGMFLEGFLKTKKI